MILTGASEILNFFTFRCDVVAVEPAGGALLRQEIPSCLGWKQTFELPQTLIYTRG